MRFAAVVASMCLVVAACGEPDSGTDVPVTAAGTTGTTVLPTTWPPSTSPPTTSPPTSAQVTPTTIDAGGATSLSLPAPWAAPALPADQVPALVAAEWQDADNRTACSALYPAAPDIGAGADLRAANFSGGWALAWDRAGGPGRNADGSYCADCGRSAFGVAGAGLTATGTEHERWPTVIDFDDGSLAGYGFEGDADPSSGAPLLMYVLVRGEGCLYNVWSFLGEDHLLGLVEELRFVEGFRGEPSGWAVPEVVEVREMGAPPWEQPALDPAGLDRIYFLEWEGEANAPASCPLLAFADLGDEASGASIRRAANAGEMLVAWDRPSGPGHDGASNPCDDCGRGAIGLGTFQGSPFLGGEPTHRWDDGSEARVAVGLYGIEARLHVDGFDCTYWLWSHLGEDHLDSLFTRLRRVAGFP